MAPEDVNNAGQKINDYLADATGLNGKPTTGCDNAKYFQLFNDFLEVAKKELGYQ